MRAHPLPIFVAGVLLAVPPTLSAQPDSVRFVHPKHIELTASELPYHVVLRNHSRENLSRTLEYFPLDTVRGATVVVDTATRSISPAGTRRWTLLRGDLGGNVWPRRGYLVAQGNGEIDTVSLTVYASAIPARLGTLPRDEWHTEVRRWTVFPALWGCDTSLWEVVIIGTCRRGVVIPVAVGRTAAPGNEQNQIMGFVAGDTPFRGTAVVVAERRDTLPGGAVGDRIRLAGLGGAGTYQGEVTLGGEKKVKLQVLVTYGLLPAALAIAFGILLAALMQRYATRDRLMLLMRARILRLTHDAVAKDREFRAALGARAAGEKYDILSSARRERDELLKRLEADARLEQTLTKEHVAPLLKDLKPLEDGVAHWPFVGRALARLHDALDALQRTDYGPIPDDVPGPTPHILEHRAQLLAGQELPLRYEAVVKERETLEKQAAFAEEWQRLNARAAELQCAADKVMARNRDSADAQKAWANVRQVRHDLWAQTGDQGSDPAALAAKLNEAEEIVVRLQITSKIAAAADEGAAFAERVERMRSEPAEPRPAPLPNPMVLLQRVRQLDCVFSVLAAMVATLIALGQVYYDGPVFGTASDFLAAFLWAFSVKAGLEVLKTFGERVFTGLPTLRRE